MSITESLGSIDPAALSDRELLLILHERISTIGRDLHELRDGTAQKIATMEAKIEMLQEHKADKSSVDDSLHEIVLGNTVRTSQINRLTNYVWFGSGVLAVLQILIALITKFGLPH